MRNYTLLSMILCLLWVSCTTPTADTTEEPEETVMESAKMRVIFDTDANNELDDQHAMAYLFFNQDVFDIAAITVNRTFNGGGIDMHMKEAERVMKLCGVYEDLPLIQGADSTFEYIRTSLGEESFDGSEAVNLIISESMKAAPENPLLLLPVGKLTNIALALAKAPEIADRVRIVWLGANYPEPGEYNLVNDIPSMNYILDMEVPFEMVMVRYGDPTGTDAVRVTPDEIMANMAGKGPQAAEEVEGRHGGTFTTFGDYSVSLFSGIDLYGDPPARALFDMAAVAIVKDPTWAEAAEIPAPTYENESWTERPDNPRKILIWENFNKDAIMADFYESMGEYELGD
ncbi:MAG: nucleoside hydrolase [Bacteroidota bacterium]